MTAAIYPIIPEQYVKEKTRQLFGMTPVRVPLPKTMPKVGVILIDDPFGGRHPIDSGNMREYASRTCSSNPKSWLADKITRRLTGIIAPDYRADGEKTLRNLEDNPRWRETRAEVLQRLPECDIRFVEVTNKFHRTLLISYIASIVCPPKSKSLRAISVKELERLELMRK